MIPAINVIPNRARHAGDSLQKNFEATDFTKGKPLVSVAIL